MSKNIFPTVITEKISGGFEAVLGLSLKSLLKNDLLPEKTSTDDHGYNSSACINQMPAINYCSGLLQAVSTWPKSITLEMHITSLPNLNLRAQGRVFMSLMLKSRARTDLKARKDVLEKFMCLQTLLLSHMSNAEFIPITNKSDLKFHLAPFNMKYAMTVHRGMERLQITQELERKTITGLLSRDEKVSPMAAYIDYIYPWSQSIDDWTGIFQIMMYDLDPYKIVVRLNPTVLSDAQRQQMEKDIKQCEMVLNSNKPYVVNLQHQASLLHKSLLNQIMELHKGALNVGVFILAGHQIDPALCNILGQTVTTGRSLSEKNSIYTGGFAISKINVNKAIESSCFPEKQVYSVGEAACAFRLPSPAMHGINGLPIRRARTCLAPLPELRKGQNGIHLCLNIHNGLTQPVLLPSDDRMRHHFVIGQTGTGKSTMLESIIMQTIEAGDGIAVLDPHDELVNSIVGKIPDSRLKDVIVFDVLDKERPLGFNLLQFSSIEERDFIIDELYDTIDKIYDLMKTGGPMFETYMRGMLKLLMGSEPSDDFKPTLLEFRNCFISSKFRKWLLSRTEEGETKDFVKEILDVQGEASLPNISPYITAKLGRFLAGSTIINIIAQDDIAFNLEEIMATGKIFLAKLGKGRFGSTVSALLANQLVSRFKNAAMKRGDMRPSERRDFYLVVDECHNLPMPTFTQLLAEARKYRLGLVLATQYAKQLQGDKPNENLLAAILGNVGTLSIFRLGIDDARLLAPALYPYFNHLDIVGLPNWQGYSKITIGKDSIIPFSFETILDQTPYNAETARKVRAISRQTYGRDLETIKKQIEYRRNIWRGVDDE